MNRLYFGDNLDILREHIADDSVDLIYLDPPFNSKRDYNLLFKTPKGHESDAQITAFEDSWHWGEQAEREFNEILRQSNTDVAELMPALRSFLGENDMMAYLVMMANRLLELHRVLKPTGSIYLHCDPTASHYLKIVLDGVFGKENYVNEIVWKRTAAHSDAKQGSVHFGRTHDAIFFYAKSSSEARWNPQWRGYDDSYLDSHYTQTEPDGRRYRWSVKGGENVNVAMVRDLAHVVAREKAEIGLFVTLAEPSKPMTTEAIKEGFYTSPDTGAEFPRIQILTISGLLDGSENARYPDLSRGGHTFKKAKVDLGKKDQGKLF